MSDGALWLTCAFGMAAVLFGWIPARAVRALHGWWKGRRVAAELAAPELGGVPLPSVTDPRWKSVKEHAECVGFHVLPNGEAYFDGRGLGRWPAYADAVFGALEAQDREALARRAWAAIVDEAPAPTEEPPAAVPAPPASEPAPALPPGHHAAIDSALIRAAELKARCPGLPWTVEEGARWDAAMRAATARVEARFQRERANARRAGRRRGTSE